ncbi:TetR/AcrR family transcriptional regulator C-terminal domain-containing protein [Streptomyces sp. NPDC058086]|uniref:TetR/AcrR family transcriptional regulator C-terminal domain-containing protein n=1 Tax=Streptomyces sp. NPDC058086 TaxID=3346334 RepID=UPI0036E93CF1
MLQPRRAAFDGPVHEELDPADPPVPPPPPLERDEPVQGLPVGARHAPGREPQPHRQHALRGDGPWDTALAAWARSYRAAFAAHPKTIPLLTTSPVRAPRVLEQYERAVTLLLDAGFPLPDVMPMITALENLVLGSALDLAAPETMWELPDETTTPRLAAALDAVGEGRADRAFELALEGFLTHARALQPA